MYLLLRPPQAELAASLRPGLSDGVDQVWPGGAAQEGRPGSRRPAPAAGRDEGPAVRGRQTGARWAQCVLPADGRTGGLRSALGAKGAERVGAAVELLEYLHRPAGCPGRPVPVPRAQEA